MRSYPLRSSSHIRKKHNSTYVVERVSLCSNKNLVYTEYFSIPHGISALLAQRLRQPASAGRSIHLNTLPMLTIRSCFGWPVFSLCGFHLYILLCVLQYGNGDLSCKGSNYLWLVWGWYFSTGILAMIIFEAIGPALVRGKAGENPVFPLR